MCFKILVGGNDFPQNSHEDSVELATSFKGPLVLNSFAWLVEGLVSEPIVKRTIDTMMSG